MKPLFALLAAAACALPGCATSGTPPRAADPEPQQEAAGTCRVRGRVDRRGMQAWVGVFGPKGRLAGRWIEARGFPFEFTRLPANTPLVTITWSPMAASAGAVDLLRAEGTAEYARVFGLVSTAIGRRGTAGASIEQILKVKLIEKPTVRVALRGIDWSLPAPVSAVVKVGLHVDESDLGEGHGCVTREFDAEYAPLPSTPIAIPIECDCGLELGWEVRVAGYEPVKRRMPLPPDPGPIEIVVELTKRACGTHGAVVDTEGRPVRGALVHPQVREPQSNGSGGIPGLHGPEEEEFEAPDDWQEWLGASPAGPEGLFPLADRMFDGRIIAVVPGVGCSAWTDLRGATAPLRLEIVPGNVIEGVVTDTVTGAPAADVTVVLEHHRAPDRSGGRMARDVPGWREGDQPRGNPDTRSGTGIAVQTDAEGRYRFAGVPPEWYVRPAVLRTPRAVPGSAAAAVDYRGGHDDNGAFIPADVAAWLAQRAELGELIRFADVGLQATRNLQAAVTPGRWLKITVQQPEGDDPIDALDVEHLHTHHRPARAGETPWKKEIDAGTTTIVRSVAIEDGEAVERVVRLTTLFWDQFNDAQDAPREATLYVPAGHNKIVFSSGEYRDTALQVEVEQAGGPLLERTIKLLHR